MRNATWAWAGLVLLSAGTGCERDKPPPGALKTFDTPAWAGNEGLLLVKSETEESDVLLLRRRPPEEGMAELFGEIKPKPDYESGEVIYRYNPGIERDDLEVVDLRTWDDAKGALWWDIQQVRRVPSEIYVAISTGKLTYGQNEIPTVGDRILYMAKSMAPGSDKIIILSAVRKMAGLETMKQWGRPKYEKYHHQAYDLDKRVPVGPPVPLPFGPDDEGVKGVWAGRDTYVVYADGLHRGIVIVHMDRLTAE